MYAKWIEELLIYRHTYQTTTNNVVFFIRWDKYRYICKLLLVRETDVKEDKFKIHSP